MQVRLAALSIWVKKLFKIFRELRVGKLGFEIALTIESHCLNETFRFVISDFEKDTVSWDLFVIIDLDDIANFDISKDSFLKLDTVSLVRAIRVN